MAICKPLGANKMFHQLGWHVEPEKEEDAVCGQRSGTRTPGGTEPGRDLGILALPPGKLEWVRVCMCELQCDLTSVRNDRLV